MTDVECGTAQVLPTVLIASITFDIETANTVDLGDG